MKLTTENFELVAAKSYLNESCCSTEEFLEDLYLNVMIRRMAKKFVRGSSNNVRLLTNHVICFTNNFELDFTKKVLFSGEKKEQAVIKSVYLYLGFLAPYEYESTDLDFLTLKLLKEMD